MPTLLILLVFRCIDATSTLDDKKLAKNPPTESIEERTATITDLEPQGITN